MVLNAPTRITFIISLVIAAIGILSGLGLLSFVPLSAFWIMTLAYVVLAGGCLLKGM